MKNVNQEHCTKDPNLHTEDKNVRPAVQNNILSLSNFRAWGGGQSRGFCRVYGSNLCNVSSVTVFTEQLSCECVQWNYLASLCNLYCCLFRL